MRRLSRTVQLADLGEAYDRVGPVAQCLMTTGRVCFRGLAYVDRHRLQFDLETTALDPEQGRIFLVAVRDVQGGSAVLEVLVAAEEAQLITDLGPLICQRDPDVIENHNLFWRPESRGEIHYTPLTEWKVGAA